MIIDDYRLTEEEYAIAEKNGISRQRARKRVNDNGWDKERAITQPLGQSLWKSYGKLCLENGVTRSQFYRRVRKGVEPQEAVKMKTI